MCAAEGGPLMWMMPLHLHVNQKSDYEYSIDEPYQDNYGKCSKISNTSCLPKRQTNSADPNQTASEEAV